MAINYYHNAQLFPLEVPLKTGGSIVIAPGKYVQGSTTATFGRSATRGGLTDDGVGEPAAVTATPALLIYVEPVSPTQGDTGSAGDTGVGTGDTGASGAKGDTGADSTVAGDTGVKGDTGTHGDTGSQGDTGTP